MDYIPALTISAKSGFSDAPPGAKAALGPSTYSIAFDSTVASTLYAYWRLGGSGWTGGSAYMTVYNWILRCEMPVSPLLRCHTCLRHIRRNFLANPEPP